MNVYSLLLGNADARINAMPWGASVITTVNMNLPAEGQVPAEVTGKELSEIIFGLEPSKRRAIFDMDVFIGETETHEQEERMHNNRLLFFFMIFLLTCSFLLAAVYTVITARNGNTDQNTLTTLFNFAGELLKIVQSSSTGGTGSE